MKRKLLFTFIFFAHISYAQVVTVSKTQFTHEQLVTEVLINSPCAKVNNITTRTGTNFGAGNGIGYFENTNPNFPIQNGVVLATGDLSGVPGPNYSDTFPGGGWPGDPQLFNYIQSLGIDPWLTGHYDATIMEFDFTPLNDSISFNFVFASNEYGFYQCEYTDAFAFFLEDQVTGVIVNMALVPSTPNEVPISVTTIRNNLYNGDCSSQNPNYFGLYYGIPNGLPNATAPINLNGQTVLMQAWQYVTPNNPYRMKLVIADRNDIEWDSAVFIEGGSMFIGNFDLGGDVTLCDYEELVLSVSTANNSIITWFFNGVPIPGQSAQTLIVTESGIYGVEITNPSAPNCILTDEIEVKFKPSALINLGDNFLKCAQDVATLTAITSEGTSPNATYTWFLNGGVIEGASGATINITEAGIYAVVVNDKGCTAEDDVVVSYYANKNCIITQGISPNGDGMNDFFDLEFLNDKFGPLEVVIFNRHGKVVFEQNNYINQWRGQTNQGKELPVGNYYYVIKFLNEKPRTGYIYLIK